ncbi:MAG: LytTR family DNA-binding domain-containing protein [Bacteroidota bacterium]
MKPPKYRCIIVDDEPLARECLENYVREIDFLETVGTASNPLELTAKLNQQAADLLFLDIQMPKMNGLDFIRQGQQIPPVILATAFPGYALEGFSLDVVDYLLKPITFNRFFQSVQKFLRRQQPANHRQPALSEDSFYVKCEQRYERVKYNEILFVQAMHNYVSIHTTGGKYLTLLFLKNVEEQLQERRFARVHKSYLVALDKIDSIEAHEIVIGPHRIPLSRHYREGVLQQVVTGKLWKK